MDVFDVSKTRIALGDNPQGFSGTYGDKAAAFVAETALAAHKWISLLAPDLQLKR